MNKLFSNILLPLEIGGSTDEEIERTIEFANQLECNLHLLLIVNRPFILSALKGQLSEQKYKLAEIRDRYFRTLKHGLMLFTTLQKGDPESRIAEYCDTHSIDLVFVKDQKRGLHLPGSRINVNRLAGRTHCPVLSMKSASLLEEQKIIVVPIGRSFPISKIRVVIYLAKHFNASVHLITLEQHGIQHEELSYMVKAFQVLKENTDLQVVCSTLAGERLGDIALQYAHSVNAGLIVVNQGEESLLSGFVSRLFSRFIFNHSRVPVMTVT